MPPLLTLVLIHLGLGHRRRLHPAADREAASPMSGVFFKMGSDVRTGIPSGVAPEQVWVLDANSQRVPTEEVQQLGRHRGEHSAPQPSSKGWRVSSFVDDGVTYVPVAGQKWIRRDVYEEVERNPGKSECPQRRGARDLGAVCAS